MLETATIVLVVLWFLVIAVVVIVLPFVQDRIV
jgi:hypothetical protein